ncbi:MAG: hypothetical protein ACREUV_05560 [Burkholderiales bacterium]
MKFPNYSALVFGFVFLLGCGQKDQNDAAAKTESSQKVRNPEKLPGQRLQQAGRTLNKAADVEKELAKNAQETERKIDQESK